MNDKNILAPDKTHVPPYGSHLIRLSLKEWIATAAIIGALYFMLPHFWNRVEPFNAGTDYRIPYKLSEDYWIFERYAQESAAQGRTLVVGDSVIWGEYVTPEQTLAHCLNQLNGAEFCANLGVNGIHPVALAGLLEYYGRALTNRQVILHFNPLWMSSPERDLQINKEFRFNHPKLVPQFYPNIPCYRATFSERASAVMERDVPFLGWANHLRVAYFDNLDIPSWTLEHPYADPLTPLTQPHFEPSRDQRHEQQSWQASGIPQQDFDWVDLSSSLQWRYFQKTLETLQQRNNKILVLVGPFNEHMLKEKSLLAYQKIKNGVGEWLQRNKVDALIPEPLPSELYGDASHPLKEGYEKLAQIISERFPNKITLSR